MLALELLGLFLAAAGAIYGIWSKPDKDITVATVSTAIAALPSPASSESPDTYPCRMPLIPRSSCIWAPASRAASLSPATMSRTSKLREATR
jgi:hypothetical protein